MAKAAGPPTVLRSPSIGSCSGGWACSQELSPEEGQKVYSTKGGTCCYCISSKAGSRPYGHRCPRCEQADLGPCAFTWLHQRLKDFRSDERRVKGCSPPLLAVTLCLVLASGTPEGGIFSLVLSSVVLLSAFAVLNVLFPYALAAYETTRVELTQMVHSCIPGASLRLDLSFEDQTLQRQYQDKLAWLRMFKDRGGAALYFLCAGGRIWGSLVAGGRDVLPLLLYLPLALLYAVRLGLERRGAAVNAALSVAHVLLSCAVIPGFYFLESPDAVAATPGLFEGLLTFLVNPVMFMATSCLSLPSVGSLRWDIASLASSLAVYLPTSAVYLIRQFRATGRLLGFDVGLEVGPVVFGLTVVPLCFAAAFNFCHLMALQKFSIKYFLSSKSSKATLKSGKQCW